MQRYIATAFSVLDKAAIRAVGERFNPFTRTGTLAVASILLALLTGVLLLPFYSLSVHSAYHSVSEMIRVNAWGAGWLHGMHRYASDLAMLFSVLHLLRIYAIGAFQGARVFSWVTGWIALGLLWFTGWTGFWLVWDQLGYLIASLTARTLDALPIFGTFLSRGLLRDDPINNQIFFTVFFVHMLIPLALFATLWLHISRVNRPKFLLERGFAFRAFAILGLFCLMVPPGINSHADPFLLKTRVVGSLFTVWPVKFFSDLPAWTVWAGIVSGLILVSLFPRLMRPTTPKPAPSTVTTEDCIGCSACFVDCPYQAIEMKPRTDDKPYALMAWVNPERCMSCGICNGSCDSRANNLPQLPVIAIESQMERKHALNPKVRWLLFACREICVVLDREALSMYCVIEVTCVGQVNPKTVKKALVMGYEGVFIATSLPGACSYREGDEWTKLRMEGKRRPHARFTANEVARIEVLPYGKHESDKLVRDAIQFAKGKTG